MTNKEVAALYESLNSVEDAYAMMKENGYTGSMDDFMALCSKVTDDMSMNLDDMEQVAGGISWQDVETVGGAAIEKTKEIASKTWDWIQKNPGTAASIVGSTVVAAAGITYVVQSHRRSEEAKGYLSPEQHKQLENETLWYRDKDQRIGNTVDPNLKLQQNAGWWTELTDKWQD